MVTNQPRVPSLGSPQAPPGDVHRSLAALPFDGVVIFSHRASISFYPWFKISGYLLGEHRGNIFPYLCFHMTLHSIAIYKEL